MSVLIREMEMPKGCSYDEPPYHCPFYECLKCTRLNNYVPPRSYEYLPNCPLVEVKTPHGNLIDYDAVDYENEKVHNAEDSWIAGAEWIHRCYANAPIIIEAEE